MKHFKNIIKINFTMTKEELKNLIDEKLPVDNSMIITGEVLNEILTAIIECI